MHCAGRALVAIGHWAWWLAGNGHWHWQTDTGPGYWVDGWLAGCWHDTGWLDGLLV